MFLKAASSVKNIPAAPTLKAASIILSDHIVIFRASFFIAIQITLHTMSTKWYDVISFRCSCIYIESKPFSLDTDWGLGNEVIVSIRILSETKSAVILTLTEQSYPVHPVNCGSPLGFLNNGNPPPILPSLHSFSH